MVEEMSNQESLPNHAFPKVHTKDEQSDEKYGLNIDNVIWHCKMHDIIIDIKNAVSN